MGRNLKNEYQIHSLCDLKDRKFELHQVKIPFYTKITYKIIVSENKKIKKKWYGTTWEIINKPISEKNEIKKEFKEQNKIVIKIEEATLPLSDHCPQCYNIGIPKIERKNASDHRLYLNGETKEKPDEYYLTYDHKIGGKISKHKVAQFIKDGFYFKKSIRKNIDLDKFIFPRFLEPETLLFSF